MLRRLVEVTLARLGEPDADVSFAFMDDGGMSARHERYMGVSGPTDVMAFPADEDGPDGARELGDVLICTDQAVRQADELGHGYPTELRILALHGLLHLLGFDHTTDEGEMRRCERRLRPLVLAR